MYFYHGYALGVASTIPGKEFNEACCALSIRGGKGSAAKSTNPLPEGITFASATSNVSGWDDEWNGLPIWYTEASVVIEGLDIFGKFSADRIEAHIFSQARAGDYESSTVITGSKFLNVKIGGSPVKIEMSDDLTVRYPTFSSMQVGFKNNSSRGGVCGCLVGRELTEDDATSPDLLAAYEARCQQEALTTLKSAVICSFVEKVSGGGCKTWGPIIAVPEFGNIYLGELVVWPWMRCLNMFRIELAQSKIFPEGGRIAGGSAGANGTTYPPGGHPPPNG